jgi:hypothetical protein
MRDIMTPGLLGLGSILFVFCYTIFLIRSGKLSAHMAISWIIAEMAFLVIMLSENMRICLRSFLGEQNAPYSLFLLGTIWIVFLMLESLTTMSSLTSKLKQVNQELTLTRARIDFLEKQINLK